MHKLTLEVFYEEKGLYPISINNQNPNEVNQISQEHWQSPIMDGILQPINTESADQIRMQQRSMGYIIINNGLYKKVLFLHCLGV